MVLDQEGPKKNNSLLTEKEERKKERKKERKEKRDREKKFKNEERN